MDSSAEGVRVDVWLWAARLYRTRALAKAGVAAGRVTVGGVACKPSRLLRPGDRLVVEREGERFELEVQALSDRRGPALVARTLYREDPASVAAREAERARRAAERAGYRPPEARPDKRARRLIRALGDFDAT
ncbi:MAG: RNA-binding S4 domain-containing protein [Xanthomonadales bacterium]|nr:RNA-binding S4 domain-containing protein [Xanthomonadales bacterium]